MRFRSVIRYKHYGLVKPERNWVTFHSNDFQTQLLCERFKEATF